MSMRVNKNIGLERERETADEEGTWWGGIFYSILPYSDHLQLAEDYVTVPMEVYLQDVHM